MKLAKLLSLVVKCCKMRILDIFVLQCGNCYHFRLKSGNNFRTQYENIQKNLQTSQSYIFRQYFTAFRNQILDFV